MLGCPLDGSSPSVQAPLFCSAAAVRATSCAQRSEGAGRTCASRRRCPPRGVPCWPWTSRRAPLSVVASPTARRRLTGAELDETGVAGMQTSGSRNKSLPLVAWEACDGDSLLALAYVLDVLKAKQEGQLDAA